MVEKSYATLSAEFYENTRWAEQLRDIPHGLFVVPTPLGHLEDISLRALVTLYYADIILCEDTRVIQTILSKYHIQKKCVAYHQHNERDKLSMVLSAVKNQRVALVSDRGTPGISDAGILLISQCYYHELPVHILPGPCSVIQSFLSAGFVESRFLFYGFLPKKKGPQTRIFQSLQNLPVSLIFFESPYRVASTLQVMSEVFSERHVAVARELTKRFEETRRGTFAELIAYYACTPPKGECIIIVERFKDKGEADQDAEA